jgi:hypothetical protein|tara:strand:+ start:2491 stop:2928 length:438 start_codon:yes stop_codon:yes gene_type:complete
MAYTTRNPEVFEILEEFSKSKNKKSRLEVLSKYSDVQALKDVLRGTFDDSLEFLLPEGKPPFTPNNERSVPSTLLRGHKMFGIFVNGGPGTDLPAYKRENKFIELLESIHPKDADLVLSMIEKKSPIKFLTKKLVQEAFPDLIRK